ncbi:hypothetical protein MAL01_07385 [Leptospira noguchii]|nr:hypothetical protein [Leptospira noguchii]UOG46395.1 hypothetical protein MAL01_07385 [Leptospira noguchii]
MTLHGSLEVTQRLASRVALQVALNSAKRFPKLNASLLRVALQVAF